MKSNELGPEIYWLEYHTRKRQLVVHILSELWCILPRCTPNNIPTNMTIECNGDWTTIRHNFYFPEMDASVDTWLSWFFQTVGYVTPTLDAKLDLDPKTDQLCSITTYAPVDRSKALATGHFCGITSTKFFRWAQGQQGSRTETDTVNAMKSCCALDVEHNLEFKAHLCVPVFLSIPGYACSLVIDRGKLDLGAAGYGISANNIPGLSQRLMLLAGLAYLWGEAHKALDAVKKEARV